MRYGFVLPWGDARTAADLAALAERHGWDGFFVWEPIWGVDAWIALAAAAMTTSRIRLGTMLTPLPRRRPWDVASQTATLDNLSGGRLILSVGLGAAHAGWLAFEPDPGRKVRAQLLDEGLEVLPTQGYDVVCEGTTPAGDPAAGTELVRPWREAGATWWIESDWSVAREAVRDYAEERLRAGPPRIDGR